MSNGLMTKKPFYKSGYFLSFAFGIVIAFLFFIPFIIDGKGIFLYYGDFNVQQIPFYRLANEAVRNGELFWNWNTDLGVNFIGSYSFYLLGSPFFWITLLFPSAFTPYLMAPLLILKFGFTALTGYAFVKRFTKTDNMAILGGLLYSFTGFNIYNIFFNHFNEAVLVFPLLLIAMDEFIINNRKFGFCLAVTLCCMINYYFFFGEVIFCTIYLIVCVKSKRYKMTFKKFMLMFFEAVLGLMLSCFIFLPSAAAVLMNPRTSDFIQGYNMVVYGNSQRYGLILSSFFFPPDLPARPNFFPDSNAKWSSVSMLIPMFSMTGVLAFFKAVKKHWTKTLLLVCYIICFIPVLNSMFSMFNYSYYARWFYMPLLIMAMITVVALERYPQYFKFSIKVTGIIILAFSFIGILPKKDGEVYKFFSLPPYPDRFWAYIAMAIMSLICVTILIIITTKYKHFTKIAVSLLALTVIMMSSYMLFVGQKIDEGSEGGYDTMVNKAINGAENMSFPDPHSEFYRIDTYEELDNLGMYLKLPTINAFHSIVPSSIMDFYKLIGVDRGVGSRPATTHTGLRGLTSVKYQLIKIGKQTMPCEGFYKIDTQNGYDVYENKNFVPMGVAYDNIISKDTIEEVSEDMRENAMLKGLYIDENQYSKYAGSFKALSSEELTYDDIIGDSYITNCKKLKENAVSYFTYNSRGFSANITTTGEKLVYFSVPYDKGFKAKVNGIDTEIIKANGGFMAVKVESGYSEIEFSYYTPGLNLGLTVTGTGIIILAGYYFVSRTLRKRQLEKVVIKESTDEEYTV